MNYKIENGKLIVTGDIDYLDLSGCTSLTDLPDNLTVGGSLYLAGCTSLTDLPDNLTVGGSLDLAGTAVKKRKYKKLKDGDYVPGRYLYADGILAHITGKPHKRGVYTYYRGKIKGHDVITDGTNYAHCASFAEGIAELQFKAAKDRGAKQYKSLDADSVISYDDAVTMYRIITGACHAGTQRFIDNLPESEIKPKYTVREIIRMTEGNYGAEIFRRFFTENGDE